MGAEAGPGAGPLAAVPAGGGVIVCCPRALGPACVAAWTLRLVDLPERSGRSFMPARTALFQPGGEGPVHEIDPSSVWGAQAVGGVAHTAIFGVQNQMGRAHN